MIVFQRASGKAGSSAGASPVILMVDLPAAPKTGGYNNNGAFVTLYGRNFGALTGTVTINGASASVYSWTAGGGVSGLDKVVIQPTSAASSGNIVLLTLPGLTSNGIAFTVRSGNIYFVDASSPASPGTGTYADPWRSPASAFSGMTSGDVCYLRTGNYTGSYGAAWGTPNLSCGSAQSSTGWIGFPGEVAQFTASAGNSNFLLYNGSNRPDDFVIANFKLVGGVTNVNGGGIVPAAEGVGATNVRVINCDMLCTYASQTFSGMVTAPGNVWTVMGNYLHDTGASPSDLDHAVYVQNGADDVEVSWNLFARLKMHYTCQFHDDVLFTYARVSFHDNTILCDTVDDVRGVAFGYMTAASTGSVYNNIFAGVGQGFGAVTIYNGTVSVYGNVLYDVNCGAGGAISPNGTGSALSCGTAPTIDVRNNIVVPHDSSTPYYTLNYGMPSGNLTFANNDWFGNGAKPAADATGLNISPAFVSPGLTTSADFHTAVAALLTGGSSAVSGVVSQDHDAVPLPYSGNYPIGPYAKAV